MYSNMLGDGILHMHRGDTFILPFYINKGNRYCPERYLLQDDDVVYVGLLEPNMRFEEAIIKKHYTKDNLDEEGNVLIKFESEDTERLFDHTYYLEIKGEFKDDQGNTFIETLLPKKQFIILE